MAIAKNPEPKNEEQFNPEPLAPGFYIDNGEMNGPYPSSEDAEAALDGTFAGKGSVVEVEGE